MSALAAPMTEVERGLREEVARLKDRYAALYRRTESLNHEKERLRVAGARVLTVAQQLYEALVHCAPDPMDPSELGKVQRVRAVALAAWMGRHVALPGGDFRDDQSPASESSTDPQPT